MGDSSRQVGSEALAQRFERFAIEECRGRSPLYERLSLEVSRDRELLTLAAHAPASQPPANLLFAAVQFLLLKEDGNELAKFYPSMSHSLPPPSAAFPAFRQFCLTHAVQILQLLVKRRVQTNEVARCSYLFPAFSLSASFVEQRPLALIEIGTSAGLLLNWDRYAYRYDGGEVHGDPNSPVHIRSSLRGDKRPTLPTKMPTIGSRVGVDLHVIDVWNQDETLWLQSLIWPEHTERIALLTAALEVAKAHPPKLVTGDALDLLPTLLDQVCSDAVPCVFHCYTLNQFSKEARLRLAGMLEEYGRDRTLFRIGAEGRVNAQPELRMYFWKSGEAQQMLLAHCDGHGRWIEWNV